MPTQITKVFIYLPGQPLPVQAGLFSWSPEKRLGEFTYAQDYLDRPDALSLDAGPLRFRRSSIRESRQDGIFGVFRDAGPDGWGRDRLGDLDEFSCLLSGPDDGVGNLCFGDPKARIQAFSLSDLDALTQASMPPTRLGGAKPKLLVEDQGVFWIAKFPEPGDPRLQATNEHVMLELARECGIDAAVSRLHSLQDGRQIILVRRFDLEKTPIGISRKGFASAYTVLGLGDPRTDGPKKSYIRFAAEASKWTSCRYEHEIWKRLVFNALVGNIDDHPRNHALIRGTDGWQLSPAFDIVASPRPDQVALAMKFSSSGAVATPESLLEAAGLLGLDPDASRQEMTTMAETILETWRGRLGQTGARASEIDGLESAFKVARSLTRSRYKLGDLMAEMPDGLPRVEGWGEMPDAGKEDHS